MVFAEQCQVMTIRNQHFVWRYYLEAWQNEDGLVISSRKGNILPPTNPRNLMAQRYYYKLSKFTSPDVVILSSFIESAPGAPTPSSAPDARGCR